MPFVSQAQRKWMHANHPEMAKEWESATPKDASLPDRVHKKPKKALYDSSGKPTKKGSR
jgi:hypothetical protein